MSVMLSDLGAWLLPNALRALVPLGAACALALLLGWRRPALRHDLLAGGLVGALLVPLLAPLAPALPLPRTLLAADLFGSGALASSQLLTSSALAIFAAVWALGALVVVLREQAARRSLDLLARESIALDDVLSRTLLESTCSRLRIARRVRLRAHPNAAGPMTWGSTRPLVVVPVAWESWSVDRRRAVLLHELTHVARLDALVEEVLLVARTVLWFLPPVWWALREAREAREVVCDASVLAAGAKPSGYASLLLRMARSAGERSLPAPTPLTFHTRAGAALARRLETLLRTRNRPMRPAHSLRLLVFAPMMLVAWPSAGLGRTPAAPPEVALQEQGSAGSSQSSRDQDSARDQSSSSQSSSSRKSASSSSSSQDSSQQDTGKEGTPPVVRRVSSSSSSSGGAGQEDDPQVEALLDEIMREVEKMAKEGGDPKALERRLEARMKELVSQRAGDGKVIVDVKALVGSEKAGDRASDRATDSARAKDGQASARADSDANADASSSRVVGTGQRSSRRATDRGPVRIGGALDGDKEQLRVALHRLGAKLHARSIDLATYNREVDRLLGDTSAEAQPAQRASSDSSKALEGAGGSAPAGGGAGASKPDGPAKGTNEEKVDLFGTIEPSRAERRSSQAELLERTHDHDDYTRATYSFEHGTRDDVERTHNDWDLYVTGYNGMHLLDTHTVTDDRSGIVDLGVMELSKAPKRTRELEELKLSPDAPLRLGHVYAVHTQDTDTDLWSVFRVLSIQPAPRTTKIGIAWRTIEK